MGRTAAAADAPGPRICLAVENQLSRIKGMAGPFDVHRSAERARARLGGRSLRPRRGLRSDRGRTRLEPAAAACLARLLSGFERPRMRDLLAELETCCAEAGVRPPSRATVYNRMAVHPTPRLRFADLPAAVQATLYNLEADQDVPAHQVVYHAFQYGDLAAIGYAAGLPWLALYQARRLRGWRRRSRGLLDAVMRTRGI